MGLGRGGHTFTGDSLSVSPTRSIATIQMLTACDVTHLAYFVQGVSKKMSFSGKTAITTFKLIQNANVGGVLESSGNLLHYGH